MKNGKKQLKVFVAVIVVTVLLNFVSCIFPTSGNSPEYGVRTAFFDLDDGVWDQERVESAITLIADSGTAVFSGNLTEEIIRHIRNTLEYWSGKIALDFRECTGLDYLPGRAFRYCKNLTSIMIPSNVTYIGWDAFSCCSSLTSIVIPSSVMSIGDGVFGNCIGLTNLTIPSSVREMGDYVFNGCNSLAAITVDIGNEWYKDINGVLFSKDEKILYCYPHEKKETSYAIPSSVTDIENGAFSYCSGLTEITLPSNLTNIGSGAFYGCSGLTSIAIPPSVRSIGSSAFSDCSGLTELTIPPSVTTVVNDVFSGCSGLTELTIPSSVSTVMSYAFSGCSGLTTLTIQSGVRNI
ncbi:MAG: leucine-rich repeat protein, partial [Fibrobacter sp.]|nr:leucine-rich repeat protein [Fibrobacter sp.]